MYKNLDFCTCTFLYPGRTCKVMNILTRFVKYAKIVASFPCHSQILSRSSGKNREKAWDQNYVTDRKWWTRLVRNVDTEAEIWGGGGGQGGGLGAPPPPPPPPPILLLVVQRNTLGIGLHWATCFKRKTRDGYHSYKHQRPILLLQSHASVRIINPWHACAARVTVVVLCVCVYPFSLLCALLGVQREVSAATARKNAVKL